MPNQHDPNCAGRPSKYDAGYLEMVYEYLDGYEEMGDVLPQVNGVIRYLEVSKNTTQLWEKAHPEFKDAMDRVREEQERCLINKGLTGTFKPQITQIMMANHGYTSKTESSVTATNLNHNVTYSADDYKRAQAELDEALK